MSDDNAVEYPLQAKQAMIEAKCLLNSRQSISDEEKKIIDSLSYWISGNNMSYKATLIYAAQSLSKLENKTDFQKRIISSLHRLVDELNDGNK